jgi:hypothetical protein
METDTAPLGYEEVLGLLLPSLQESKGEGREVDALAELAT